MPRTCRRCGSSFSTDDWRRRYCTATCRDAPKVVSQQCRRCSAEFVRKNNAQVFCTPRCRQLAQRGKYDSFNCVQCGKTCTPGADIGWSARYYCGRYCRSLAVAGTPKGARWVEGPCPECGVRFMRDRHRQRTDYCTHACSHRVRQRARRALVATGGGGRIHTAEIAARDGWDCGICGDAVDPSIPWPELLSPALDHIVPLVRGGRHEATNLQIAHLVCNSRKGATTDRINVVNRYAVAR